MQSKPKKRKIKINLPNILSVTSIITSIIFSILALNIANKGVQLSVDEKHFDTLLQKTDAVLSKDSVLIEISSKQVDSLVALNKILTKQLSVFSQIQKIQLDAIETQEKENILKLENNIQAISMLLNDGMPDKPQFWDSTKRSRIFNEIIGLIGEVYTNPVLLYNDTLHELWQGERLSVYGYLSYNSSNNRNIILEINGKKFQGTEGDWKNYVNDLFLGETEIIDSLAIRTFRYAIKVKRQKFPTWNNKYNIFRE